MKKILFITAFLFSFFSYSQIWLGNTDRQKVTTFEMNGPVLEFQIQNDELQTVDLSQFLDAPTASEIVTALNTQLANTRWSVVEVPSGGTTGQVLKKDTNTDYDYSWQDDGGSGGTYTAGNGLNLNTNEFSIDSARVVQKDFGSINLNGLQLDWGNRAYLDGLPDPPSGVDRLEIEIDGADPGDDLNYQKITLTDLDYDSSTNIEVVPAPGVGKVIVIDRVFSKSNITSTYSGSGTNPFLYLGWDAATYKQHLIILHLNDYIANGQVWKTYPAVALPSFSFSSSNRIDDIENVPLTVSLTDTATSISGGSGTIEIEVWYSIENL